MLCSSSVFTLDSTVSEHKWERGVKHLRQLVKSKSKGKHL